MQAFWLIPKISGPEQKGYGSLGLSIPNGYSSSANVRGNRIYKNIRIAALFVLPLGIALFFMLHSGQQEKTEIAQNKSEILPYYFVFEVFYSP